MNLANNLNKLDKNELIDIVKNLAEHDSNNLEFIEAFMYKNKILNAKTITDKNVKMYALILNHNTFIEQAPGLKEKNPKLLG